MSVTGPSANTNAIQRLSELELKKGIIGEGSWHNQYKDSCYIFIGGLDTRMTEGDIIIVFSQFGEPIDINLKRDKTTGKSLGYCFLGYKDQRSTILAVDNFNGSTLLGRRIRVDHVMDYSPPVVYEDELDEEGNKVPKPYEPTGAEGGGIDKYYITKSEILLKETAKKVQDKPKQVELDEDERWALEFEESLKREKELEETSHKKEEHRERRRSDSRDRLVSRRKEEEEKPRRRERDHERKHRRERSHRSRNRSKTRSRERESHRSRDHRRRRRSRSYSSERNHRRRHRKSRSRS